MWELCAGRRGGGLVLAALKRGVEQLLDTLGDEKHVGVEGR